MAKIIVLTGAGISAESGIDTFRDPKGVWTRDDPMKLASVEGFAEDPARVMRFYNERRANARAAKPNAAHLALARLEAGCAGDVLVVTQNVDTLHEAAGSRAVLHMHGTLEGALCHACGARWPAPLVMALADPCPVCAAPRTRPDIVWFGEIPYHMEEILTALRDCEHFAVIGSSGAVYPAAGLVDLARQAGAETCEINLNPSQRFNVFDDIRQGLASELVPIWVDELLRERT